MGTARKTPLQESIETTVQDLETVAEEIQLKLHLAGMDANKMWTEKLEPKLHEARAHARDMGTASKAAVEEVVAALKKFAASL